MADEREIFVEFVSPPEDFLDDARRRAPAADPTPTDPTPADALVTTGNTPAPTREPPAQRIRLAPGRSYLERYLNARMFRT